jgi:uncharacterized membrane protein
MGIGRRIVSNDEKGYVTAIFLAVIIAFAIVVGYFAVNAYNAAAAPPQGYNTINMLSEDKQATNYPEVLVANQNSTFKVWITIENHLGTAAQYRVETKITKNLTSFPVEVTPSDSYDMSLTNGASWASMHTITLNETGDYAVVFELWQQDAAGNYQFTHNYTVLRIQVIS